MTLVLSWRESELCSDGVVCVWRSWCRVACATVGSRSGASRHSKSVVLAAAAAAAAAPAYYFVER